MYCKNCGNQVNAGAAVCVKCGVEIGKGGKFCSNCGAQPDPLASVCVSCGCSLKSLKPSQNSGVNSFGGAISTCFKKYATFSGRANRSEFWFFNLFVFLGTAIPVLLIASLIPGCAVAVRRLHDIGKSGWTCLLGLIPIVGWIMLLIWYCQPGQEGENKYGSDPNA